MQSFNGNSHWDLLIVWAFSIASFLSMNNLVGFFAIIASIFSIIKSAPAVIAIIKKFLKHD